MSESGPEEQPPIPEDYRQWLKREADRRGMAPEELLEAIVLAHQSMQTAGASDEPITLVDQSDLDAIESKYMDLLEDVRDRVIQVKRETDKKAPADHEHPDLEQTLTATTESLTTLEQTLDTLDETVDELDQTLDERVTALESDLQTGFENYEEILEYLLETTDTLQERLDTLAQATLQTRERLRDITGSQKEREAIEELKATANTRGISTAICESCENRVRIGLLTSPHCPHCGATFTGLESTDGLRGLFGSPRLTTGDRPALTGRQQPALDEQIEADLTTDRNTMDESAVNLDDADPRTTDE